MTYVPERGDAIWINFNPQAGHEQAGRRPGVVLSLSSYNSKTGLALICPITNQRKGLIFEVALPPGLPVTGVVLSDHVKNLDWRARDTAFICTLPPDVVDDVIATLNSLL
jgi:mRNA interferase MazF